MSSEGELILLKHHSPGTASNTKFLVCCLTLERFSDAVSLNICRWPLSEPESRSEQSFPDANGQPDVLKICTLLWGALSFMLVILLCYRCHLR